MTRVLTLPLAAWVVGLLTIITAGPIRSVAAEIDFGRDVLPILSQNCFQCHGPDEGQRQADLRLDTAAGARVDLGGYAAVVPDEPGTSALIDRIIETDPDLLMPPPESGKSALSKAQVDTLRQWIAGGAQYQQHWSLRPIEVLPPSPIRDGSEASVSSASKPSQIDQYLIARLSNAGLTYSEPISRRKLIRRATFDLIGLPPTWRDVQAFVDDPDSDDRAFAKVIDRLLGSAEYGERWGRHWLDLARYADTHGSSAIGFTRFPFSYTYRDYVIGAFNADLPYNQFVLEQLAADQLGLADNDPARAALGFLTVGEQYRNRHDVIDDQIDVIGRGLMGLTLACARCHDHKFDPVPTTDYYALHAVLAASHVPEDLPLVGKQTIAERYQSKLATMKRQRNDISREQGEVMRGRLRMQIGLYLRELAKGTPEQDTSTAFLSYRTEDIRPVVLERWRKYVAATDENDPVFGPWHRLAGLTTDQFAQQCQEVVSALQKENGDPKAFVGEQNLTMKPPRWNPRVLQALAERQPNSFVEVAEVYGGVFASTHRKWQTALLEAALEASPDGKVIPDEHENHRVVNSSIERQLRRHLYDPASPTALPMDSPDHRRLLNRGVRDKVSGTFNAIHGLNLSSDAPARSMELRESSSPKDAYVFVRGNPVRRGEQVQPRFLTILSNVQSKPFEVGRLRLGLAQAIVDPANPLSRRVIVNWVWQHHFGRGLVRTPDDFGALGQPPTHPQLLDFLATEFLENGWSIKSLHRRIMLTQAYRQGSLENPGARLKDPDNQLLWRMNPRKLDMESMRDALLSVSGELKLDDRGGRPFEESANKVVPRRSLYAFINRDIISPLAGTFDGANPSSCTMQRTETMVPQQTLFALNSEFIQGRAKALLELTKVSSADPVSDRIRAVYHRVYARQPSEAEIQLAKNYLDVTNERSWMTWVHALLAANEFHFVD